MKFAIFALSLVFALVLPGCASSAKRENTAATSVDGAMDAKAAFPLKHLQVTLSDAAKVKSTENLKFDPNKLNDTLKRALESKGLLKVADAGSKGRVEVEVTDIRVRSNFTATALGILAGTDNVDGTVRVFNANGVLVDTVKVSASYGLGGVAYGQDDARMSWLYEKFAEESTKALMVH